MKNINSYISYSERLSLDDYILEKLHLRKDIGIKDDAELLEVIGHILIYHFNEKDYSFDFDIHISKDSDEKELSIDLEPDNEKDDKFINNNIVDIATGIQQVLYKEHLVKEGLPKYSRNDRYIKVNLI